MADGVTLPATGAAVATDETASGHVQIIKLAISTDGSVTLIGADATNGLDVDVTRLPDVVLAAGANNVGSVAVNNLPAPLSVTGTGGESTALRVTIASDSTGLVSVDDNAGSLTVDAPVATPVFVRLSDGASAITTLPVSLASAPSTAVTNAGVFAVQENATAASTLNSTSSDGGTALTNSAQSIKGAAGTLHGYYIYNPNTTAQFVQLFNTASGSVTVGTTNPLFMITVPAGSAANLWMAPIGIAFSTAISWAATSTAGGNGAPTTALDAVAWYK
jgi:hypothetical protein